MASFSLDNFDQNLYSRFVLHSFSGVTCASDVWALVPSGEVRALREEHPSLLATLCYKCKSCACQQNLKTLCTQCKG